jgi:hypothetical protein
MSSMLVGIQYFLLRSYKFLTKSVSKAELSLVKQALQSYMNRETSSQLEEKAEQPAVCIA